MPGMLRWRASIEVVVVAADLTIQLVLLPPFMSASLRFGARPVPGSAHPAAAVTRTGVAVFVVAAPAPVPVVGSDAAR